MLNCWNKKKKIDVLSKVEKDTISPMPTVWPWLVNMWELFSFLRFQLYWLLVAHCISSERLLDKLSEIIKRLLNTSNIGAFSKKQKSKSEYSGLYFTITIFVNRKGHIKQPCLYYTLLGSNLGQASVNLLSRCSKKTKKSFGVSGLQSFKILV